MISKKNKHEARVARQRRVRATVKGTASKPRLCVFKSLNNIYAQVIDDDARVTLVSASTLDADVKTKASNIEAAKEVGALVAKRAIEKNIETVVFDRNGYLYHGKVQALADAAREAGLKF
ncbi:50S ribosomal protein L18 [Clostridium sp. CAG:921]|nr:50S ribosomal protein L18 [Clostridium sp. CAG:921]